MFYIFIFFSYSSSETKNGICDGQKFDESRPTCPTSQTSSIILFTLLLNQIVFEWSLVHLYFYCGE